VKERADVAKRDTYSGRATWFVVGLGACGDYSQPSDFLVALNTAQYGGGYPGPECFKSITIQYNGITQVATILDECPTCNYGDLDMSQGLFDSFTTPDVGEFQMVWWYNDGSDDPAPTTSTPWVDPAPWTTDQPTSTSTPWVDPAPWTTDQPTTTSQWVDPAPWTTDQPTSTSTSTSTTTSTTSTTSTSSSQSTSSTTSGTSTVSLSGTPTTLDLAPSETAGTTTPDSETDGNIVALGQLVVGFGSLVAYGATA